MTDLPQRLKKKRHKLSFKTDFSSQLGIVVHPYNFRTQEA